MKAVAVLLLLAATSDVPRVAFTVPIEHRLVEGVAVAGDTTFVSSILDRTILVRRAEAMRSIAMPAGTPHPMGLAWDTRRRWLWIAADCPNLPGVTKCDAGALVAIDVSGKLKASFAANAPFHPGDVSVGGGSVFVSDSGNGAVFRLAPAAKALATVIAPGVGKSAQGTALAPNGKHLIVADYSQGIAAIHLATGARTPLAMSDGRSMRGIDGLVRSGDRYFAIYNGSAPAILFSFRVGRGKLADAVILKGDPLTDPTQIAVTGDHLRIVADSGWATMEQSPSRRAKPATVIDMPIAE